MIHLIKIVPSTNKNSSGAVDLVKTKQVAKGSNNKDKPDDMTNNHFALFANQDKYISGQMAAAVYKYK